MAFLSGRVPAPYTEVAHFILDLPPTGENCISISRVRKLSIPRTTQTNQQPNSKTKYPNQH
jgi:hypothetical protein